METYTYTFDRIGDYQLAMHGLTHHFADQIIGRDSDTLSITVTEFGACCIESAIGYNPIYPHIYTETI